MTTSVRKRKSSLSLVDEDSKCQIIKVYMIKNRVNKKQGFIKTDFPFSYRWREHHRGTGGHGRGNGPQSRVGWPCQRWYLL